MSPRAGRTRRGQCPVADQGEAPAIAVRCDSSHPERVAYAAELARTFGLPLTLSAEEPHALLLVVTDERLELLQVDSSEGPVHCEFTGGAFGYRRAQPLRRELLARAAGFKGAPLHAIDMTAGLGRDAAVLALLGCRVTAIERHPVVFALLEDGLRRARNAPDAPDALAERLTLVRADACDYLDALPADARPDVIYLDPMFPERTRSALVKKEMRLLSRLVGAEEDADRLLEAALRTGCHRVVVKRPLHAPHLVAPLVRQPPLQFRGRSARFDVYFPDTGGAVRTAPAS